jgi:hypothetical protein
MQRSEDAAHKQHVLQTAANALVANRTPDQLRDDLLEREGLLAEADRVAQLDPNPANLSRYRFAHSQVEAARAALDMLSRNRSEVG